MLFHSYIEYKKNLDQKSLIFWKYKLKPCLSRNYAVVKNGIFTKNIDIEILINQIDNYINDNMFSELKMKMDEIKNKNPKINSDKENKNLKSEIRSHSSTLASTSTCDSLPNENNINFLNNNKNKKEIKSSINNNNIKENDINNKITNKTNEVNVINDKKDENAIDENLNINNFINENNNIFGNKKNIFFSDNPKKEKKEKEISSKDKSEINIIDEFTLEEGKSMQSKTQILFKGITRTFIDKEEAETNNIIYNSNHKNKIKLIDSNLFLKKIIQNDFYKKNNEILYAFIKQSFFFFKKEIFIEKIINCYKYYKKIEPFSKNINLENLIYFLDAYIIEMFLFYKNALVDSPIISTLNSFYKQLVCNAINSINLGIFSIFGKIEKNELLKEEICLQKVKIGENSQNIQVKDYSNKFIRKKLILRINKNFMKLKKLKQKNKIRKSHIIANGNFKNLMINNNSTNNIDDKNNSNSSHYLSNSLNFSNIFDESKINKKKRKKLSKNTINNDENDINSRFTVNDINYKEKEIETTDTFKEIIIDDTSEKYRNKSFRESKKSLENFESTDLIDNDSLVEIIGSKYKKIIKNCDSYLLSKEETFLNNLKNITFLLNLKKYNHSDVLKIKSHETFYEKFPFYEGKDLEDELQIKKEGLKKTLTKSISLSSKDFIINTKKKILQEFPKKYFCVLDWEPAQIGEKLISISINLLNKIEYKELYGAMFSKKQKGINSPNVMENIKRFNDLTFFVIEDILSYDFPKDRAKMIDRWVEIAQYCKNRKDQSNCFAIISALNHYSINGLDLTFKEVKSKTKIILNKIKEYCNLEGNNRVFRDEIKNIKQGEFFVPYLGCLLRDLTYFEEEGKYLEKGSLINLDKIEKVQNSLDNFFKFKSAVNNVNIDNDKINELFFFENLEYNSEEELEKISNNLEPVFKLRLKQSKEKRVTKIDQKYFFNELKRASVLITHDNINLK